MSDCKTVMLMFTSSFPYGKGEPYIGSELDYLVSAFDKIIIISNEKGKNIQIPLPEKVHVKQLSYDLPFLKKLISLTHLFSKNFWKEVSIVKNKYRLPVTWLLVKTLLVCMETGEAVSDYLHQMLRSEKLHMADTKLFLYSYWFNNMAYGIARFKAQHPNIVAFTRVHRWDIYFEAHPSRYLPMREAITENLNALFFISMHGLKYFSSRIGGSVKLKLSYLGIKNVSEPSVSSRHSPLSPVQRERA